MIVPPAAADAVGLRMATPVMQDACVPSRDGRRYMPRGDGQGDSPEARGATGQMMAAFKLHWQAGTSDSDSLSESEPNKPEASHRPALSLHGNRRSEAEAIYDDIPHRPRYDGQDGARRPRMAARIGRPAFPAPGRHRDSV